MRKQVAIVFLLMLVFAGVGSSAVVNRKLAHSRQLAAALQQEKRLGPKPTPRWYWHWLHWRLTGAGATQRRPAHRLRPMRAPHRIPHWAWRRLHFFLLARALADKVTGPAQSSGADTTTSTGGGGPSDGENYADAISYTSTRPSFVPSRTVTVGTASELLSAIANLQPGDLVKATAAFTVAGETVIKNRLSAPAELDLSGVSFLYAGGANLPAVWMANAQNLYIFGGDLSTAGTGGTCLLDYGSQHVLWWGFYAHDCGSGGFAAMPVGAAVSGDDFQGEVTKVGQNLARDPHSEKGTGIHAALLWDSGSDYAFMNNRFAFYVHDIPTGAGVEVGNSVVAPASGNVLYLRAVNLTDVSTIQTGGSGIEFWGVGGLGMDVKYLEVENAEGRALDANGLYAGSSLGGVTVEYGRASGTNQNPNLNEPQNRLPWDPRGGVVYQMVQPAS
jgi:hypothetical protein